MQSASLGQRLVSRCYLTRSDAGADGTTRIHFGYGYLHFVLPVVLAVGGGVLASQWRGEFLYWAMMVVGLVAIGQVIVLVSRSWTFEIRRDAIVVAVNGLLDPGPAAIMPFSGVHAMTVEPGSWTRTPVVRVEGSRSIVRFPVPSTAEGQALLNELTTIAQRANQAA